MQQHPLIQIVLLVSNPPHSPIHYLLQACNDDDNGDLLVAENLVEHKVVLSGSVSETRTSHDIYEKVDATL